MQIGSNLGENLDLLLRGVLSKLQQAETLSIIQVNHGRTCCSTRFTGILGANLRFVHRFLFPEFYLQPSEKRHVTLFASVKKLAKNFSQVLRL